MTNTKKKTAKKASTKTAAANHISKKKQVFKDIKKKVVGKPDSSKMEKSVKLFQTEIKNKEPSRTRLVGKLKSELKMTTGGANSYVSSICKKHEYLFVKPESKMDKAVSIYDKHSKKYWDGKITRNDIIKLFIKDAGLTRAGAKTYFELIKNREVEDEMN